MCFLIFIVLLTLCYVQRYCSLRVGEITMRHNYPCGAITRQAGQFEGRLHLSSLFHPLRCFDALRSVAAVLLFDLTFKALCSIRGAITLATQLPVVITGHLRLSGVTVTFLQHIV